ncbi:transmembrane protein 135-like isoform X3 [Biomphalaria glabrata]|uniref:Transmembrane protein 135-like isoform X3 n=1 Tax=Biomphalaria glabrata TaxID=6526 RepID=A0A9W3ASA4_BIOGL|nr:transmembrane protein 135-like isoform X3 [Biomphalaria glabrata]
MAVFSKPLTVTHTCYELGHCWTPYCRTAALDIARHVFKEAIKIYGTLYFIAALLRRKDSNYYRKKLIPETLRSTIFLTINGTLFIIMFCAWRRLVGFYLFYNVYLCAIPACILSLHLEHKSRRGQLAVYLTNLALETGYRMLVERQLITPVHNGEVYIFSLVSAIYLYLFRKQNGLPSSTVSLFRFIMGSEESFKDSPSQGASLDCQQVKQASKTKNRNVLERSSGGLVERVKSRLLAIPLVGGFIQEVFSLVSSGLDIVEDLPRHLCCPHKYSCLSYILKGGLRMFSLGFLMQAALSTFSSFTAIVKKPTAIFRTVFNKVNTKLALFLGSYCAIFRAVSCLLRWMRNKDSDQHALVAGALAGFSLRFYKSITIALYAATKLLEILYFKGIQLYKFPYFKSADICIYAFSTAFIFHAAVMEPHTLRPAYWKFLLRVTENKFSMMNRQLLDVFGVHSSKLYPDYWPNYVPGFTQLTKVSK